MQHRVQMRGRLQRLQNKVMVHGDSKYVFNTPQEEDDTFTTFE